ncbi:MAG: hypothetical protein HC804_14635 [Anaerolineae bacterium]|nr:hypothetical protein [Anaerolineae bacterium]
MAEGLFWVACLLLFPGKAEYCVALPAGDFSADLLAAQERLAQLQAKSRAERVAAGKQVDHGRISPPPALLHIPANLPAHLGWGSTTLTAVARQSQPQQHNPSDLRAWNLKPEPNEGAQPPDAPSQPLLNTTIKLYPDIAAGLFQQELTAPGRIWLLLRHLDKVGCGWLPLTQVRNLLTAKDSAWRVCGWRQLRNLLNQGEGVFWVRHNGRTDSETRLWLRSTTNVAIALQLPRLTLAPIALPAALLTKSIGEVRAHLYASFHSSRGDSKGSAKRP